MLVKFKVIHSGQSQFTSPKTGQTYTRAKLIGETIDFLGNSTTAIAEGAFGFVEDVVPQVGDSYMLSIVALSNKSGIDEISFDRLSPLPKK